jgi:hypothetical protein
LQKAYENIQGEKKVYGEECEKGCLRCLWTYRNKRDIQLIDKNLILPLLQESIHITKSSDNEIKKKLDSSESPSFEIMSSLPNSLDVAKFLRNELRSSKKEIRIFLPRITDEKASWDDEGSKNWIDVLIHIRKSEKNPIISLYVKKSDYVNESILKKLIDNDIDVYYVDEIMFESSNISSEHMMILIDPYEEIGRKSFEASSGLTEQLWKNRSTVFLSKNNNAINAIKNKISKIAEFSKKISKNDLIKLEEAIIYSILPKDKDSLTRSVSIFEDLLKETKFEIKLLDPYMKSNDPRETLKYYMSYFCKFLNKNVKIKIITSGHDLREIQNVKSSFSSYGYDIDIISYELIRPNTRISHRRFMVIDNQKTVWIDKGLRFLYENNFFGSMRELSNFGILLSTSVVNEDTKIFDSLWDYERNESDNIKNWPKFDSRGSN